MSESALDYFRAHPDYAESTQALHINCFDDIEMRATCGFLHKAGFLFVSAYFDIVTVSHIPSGLCVVHTSPEKAAGLVDEIVARKLLPPDLDADALQEWTQTPEAKPAREFIKEFKKNDHTSSLVTQINEAEEEVERLQEELDEAESWLEELKRRKAELLSRDTAEKGAD